MLTRENIICISSIDWDFLWQGHQEIMSTFASQGNRVLFIENTGVRRPALRDLPRLKKRIRDWWRGVRGFRQERENLYIFSPIVLPFPYSRACRQVNRLLLVSAVKKWMRSTGFFNPIIWTFLPTGTALDLIERLDKKLVIYYCIDSFGDVPATPRKLQRSEQQLITKADLVFATSQKLEAHCSQYKKEIYRFPFGVNVDEFEDTRTSEVCMPDDLVDLQRPLIGYIGGIHQWVDLKLVQNVARQYPMYSFVFIGPLQSKASQLSGINNLHFLGPKAHHLLPQYIKFLDVGIIPYRLTDYTAGVYPTKLNEYFAMGKPVVATRLPEVETFNRHNGGIVYIADDSQTFGSLITDALQARNDESAVALRVRAARRNAWSHKIDEMSDLIELKLEEKRREYEKSWTALFRRVYTRSRWRLIMPLGTLFLVWFILFKTPAIWYIAEPLKISQLPQKAEAIVVFGGGVGERGYPRESTIERARYAVQLYEGRYAGKILFSSGYTYETNDAQNMRLLALALGVPEEDIILETMANRAYENVKFSSEILKKRNWSSALVVSAPYNMRRLALTYQKLSGITPVFTPVPKSQFYDKQTGSRWDQIRAIAHEYAAIVYYWWNGWI